MKKTFKADIIRFEPIQSFSGPDPENSILILHNGGDIGVTDRVWVIWFVLVCCKFVVLRIKTTQAARARTYPKTPMAVFIDRGNVLSYLFLVLGRDIMLEGAIGSGKQVEPTHGAQPEIVILIDIQNVDVVIA